VTRDTTIKRVVWFVALYVASVVVIGGVAYLLRALLRV
jgi:Protein of unknown function (DUF2474)